jgi:hypothetical protein
MRENEPMKSIDDNLYWYKSSASQGGGCVEIAHLQSGGVFVRDSKHPGDARLEFTEREWRAFLIGAKNGEFDQR